MSDKSHVTLQQERCAICLNDYDTGALLLDKRLRKRFDMHTVTGWGICPECDGRINDGYIAMIPTEYMVEGDRVDFQAGQEGRKSDEVAWLRNEAFTGLFNAPASEDDNFVFITPDVMDYLKGLVEGAGQ